MSDPQRPFAYLQHLFGHFLACCSCVIEHIHTGIAYEPSSD